MRFRQVLLLFDAGTEAHAGPFAAPERDQRMRELVALAHRVLFVPDIDVGEDALAPPGRGPDQEQEGDDEGDAQTGEQFPVDAAQKQDAHRDADHDAESAEVGLQQQQQADHAHHDRHRQKAAQHFAHVFLFAHGVIGREQHAEQFHQFRRLQIEQAHRNPAPRAVDAFADEGHEHQNQQDEGEPEQHRRQLLPALARNLESDHRTDEGHADRHHMAREEIGLGEVRIFGRIGERDRGRIDHDGAEQQQGERGPDQHLIEIGRHPRAGAHRRMRRALTEPGGDARQHNSPASSASSRTVSTKTSARCA